MPPVDTVNLLYARVHQVVHSDLYPLSSQLTDIICMVICSWFWFSYSYDGTMSPVDAL